MVEWLERNRSNLATVVVVLVAVAAFTLLQLPRRPALQLISPAATPLPASIKVHVTGAVAGPGVYSLPVDARVEDALKAAGGPTDTAETAFLNLATPLKDGQQVVIPAAGADSQASSEQPVQTAGAGEKPLPVGIAVASSSTPVTSKLDLNSATRAQLEDLPGIGTVLSQRILDYRAKNGRFSSVEELKEAKLVNASTFEKIRGLVEVR
ncbi:MAG TPA: ComEA family DNA-binding protein [Chloroflexota bacterium]|nr:ComEA family DNA-binding protein [Chloroflexota bacterium]